MSDTDICGMVAGLSEILIDSRLIYYRNKFINEGLSRKEAENEAKRKIRFEFS